jgi:hypothetical protein
MKLMNIVGTKVLVAVLLIHSFGQVPIVQAAAMPQVSESWELPSWIASALGAGACLLGYTDYCRSGSEPQRPLDPALFQGLKDAVTQKFPQVLNGLQQGQRSPVPPQGSNQEGLLSRFMDSVVGSSASQPTPPTTQAGTGNDFMSQISAGVKEKMDQVLAQLMQKANSQGVSGQGSAQGYFSGR